MKMKMMELKEVYLRKEFDLGMGFHISKMDSQVMTTFLGLKAQCPFTA